jgi:hypothetical protein
MADLAAQGPQPSDGLPHTDSLLTITEALGTRCVVPECSTTNGLRAGAAYTLRVAPGVVRTVRPTWCPQHRYVPEQLEQDSSGHTWWALRDQRTGRLLSDEDDEDDVIRWLMRDSAVAFAAGRRYLDQLKVL